MEIRTIGDLGAAVREARAQRQLTQEELARQAGVSREWLVRLEQGRRPRVELQLVLDTLAVLGLTLSTENEPAAEDDTAAAWDEVFTNLANEPTDAPAPRATDERASDDG